MRSEHAPDDDAAGGEADVDAELADPAGVVLGLVAGRGVVARDTLRRAEHETDAGRDAAGQHADLDPGDCRNDRSRDPDRRREQGWHYPGFHRHVRHLSNWQRDWKKITERSRNLAHDRWRKIGLAAEYVEAVLTATAWRPSAAL